jgi:GNAT superfamily N-acetyltransferase
MKITFRNYVHESRFGEDYHKVWEFLNRINEEEIITPNFVWGRWVWLLSRPVDNEEQKNLIGLWEDEGKIVALVTFELVFGEVFVCVDKNYRFLLDEIIAYAKESLSKQGSLKIIINDNDKQLQNTAVKHRFRPTERKQSVAELKITDELQYRLPEGFQITSMAENWDFTKYHQVMWRGFNHGDDVPQSEEDINFRKTMLSSPHLAPELTVAVVAPNGEYAAHCGLWYHPNNTYAYVEPVATDPNYRKLGLAKAAIYEAVLRAKKAGATEAYVTSSQQFYYNIGFIPHVTETWWESN